MIASYNPDNWQLPKGAFSPQGAARPEIAFLHARDLKHFGRLFRIVSSGTATDTGQRTCMRIGWASHSGFGIGRGRDA
jgi:hypothetical protein